MADSLASALERLHLDSVALEDKEDSWIDHILHEQRPRKKVKQDPEELKRQLEQKYLTPPKSFSTEWLNRLQQ
jgi:antiviral helicase SKI2